MIIGAHESVAGGLEMSPARALEDGCEAFQIFTSSPVRWGQADLAEEQAERFRRAVDGSTLEAVLVHGSYLVNPASSDHELRRRSLGALRAEYDRCGRLGADYLVIHPGSGGEQTRTDAAARAGDMIAALFDGAGEGPVLLLENTAGSGHALGASFTELQVIHERCAAGGRVAFCLDTAHAFAAGYDLATPRAVERTLRRLDGEVGLDRILAFHLNDSAGPSGSGVDRHARIGEGVMGLEPFRCLVNSDRLRRRPAVIETRPLPVRRARYRDQVLMLQALRGDAG